jgi:asparagine synthase (glutamine-hydrolysing)
MIRSPAGRALEAVPLAAWTRVAGAMGKSGHHWGGVIKDAVRLAASARSFQDVYRSFLDEWSLDGSPVRAVVEAPGFPWLHEHSPDSVRGMYCDAVAYLPDDILCKVDRASMAVSLETRVPFLDHRLAQVAARIPLAMKVRGREGKLILRRLLGRELPRELFERRKAGFAIPVGDWIRGPLLEWAEHLLHPSRIERDGWFDVDAVRSRWAQHRSGVRDHTPSLWSVLMFQAWLDQETGRSAPALSDRGKVSAVE